MYVMFCFVNKDIHSESVFVWYCGHLRFCFVFWILFFFIYQQRKEFPFDIDIFKYSWTFSLPLDVHSLCKNSDQVSHLNTKMCVSCFSSAADWKLDEPSWSGRMKITAKGKIAYIKLEDKNTGKHTLYNRLI